jgi:predicted DCC family thiol-disulfide oxidoreductase YuxK
MTKCSSQTTLRENLARDAQHGLSQPGVKVEVFYDGDCPLCVREIRLLRWLDRHDRIGFVDIAASSFDARLVGRTHDQLMARIHGRLPGGELIEGVEVFRRLYAAVGFGPLVALTRIPGISHLLDGIYRLFARHRLRLTGRCTATTCR